MRNEGMTHMERDYQRLLFAIRKSVRYHMRRQNYFDGFSRFTNGASLIFGASALVVLLGDMSKFWWKVIPAIVGVFSILSLVYETPRMARLHSELARRFIDLEKEMVTAESRDENALKRFTDKRLEIEMDEPPIHGILNILCHNEMILAEETDEKKLKERLYSVTRFQRRTSQILNLDDSAIRKGKSEGTAPVNEQPA